MANLRYSKMKAVKWEQKPFSVSVDEVDIPKIKDPFDALVRITSAAICGSDLHTYRGRLEMNKGITFGHENIGIVEEVGEDITTLKKGDRVVVDCFFDEPTDNTDVELISGIGLGDYPGLPQRNGGQANYILVPFANVNLLPVSAGEEHELDYLLLADIWPTAWWALDCAGQVIGDTVVVFGAGPVGLLAAYSALIRGATRVYSVDRVPLRLAKAKSIGAIPINFAEVDPVAEILKHEPDGVDRSCDCVGFECVDGSGKNVEGLVISWAVNVTRSYGGIGLIGVYIPDDQKPAAPSEATGVLPFPVGTFWVKGQSIKGGPVELHLYQDLLKNLIESGKGKPSFVFDAEYRIEQAAEAYRDFSEHKIIKAVFKFTELEKPAQKNGFVARPRGRHARGFRRGPY